MVLDIVIVTYNSADVLEGLLDSLAQAIEKLPDARVIIADNASSDASTQIAARHALAPTVIEVGYNAGYAAAINVAVARCAREGALLLLNADIRLERNCIVRMLDRLALPFIGVVIPKTLHEDGTLNYSIRQEPSLRTAWSEALLGGWLSGWLGIGEVDRRRSIYGSDRRVTLGSGAILMVSSAARRLVGNWDERYFLYSEEVDYQRRARQAGLGVIYAADAVCTHIGGESNVNARLFALLTANKVRYYRQHHGAVATAIYRLAILSGCGLRSLLSPVQRAAFRAACLAPSGVGALMPAPHSAKPSLKEP